MNKRRWSIILMVILMGAQIGCKVDHTNTTNVNTDPPTVVDTLPIDGTTGYPATNTYVGVQFSKPMDETTLTTANFFLSSAVTGTVLPYGTVAYFVPDSALASNTTYTVTVTTGVADKSGLHLASDYVWSFTTGT